MRKHKLKAMKREIKSIMDSSDEEFEEVMNKMTLSVENIKAWKINKRGRMHIKSSANKVLVDPNYKWEGTESIKFREYSKYAELITPYENIYFSYMNNPKKVMEVFLNMESEPLSTEGRERGNGKKIMTNNKYIKFGRST